MLAIKIESMWAEACNLASVFKFQMKRDPLSTEMFRELRLAERERFGSPFC